MAAKIKASVGRKGKNLPDDVKTVQSLLNGFAGKVKISKVKVDGQSSGALEKAIGAFQQEACGLRPDYRVDPRGKTITTLMAGPAKLEAERKAKIAEVEKHIENERKRARDRLQQFVDKAVKSAGLPYNIARAVMLGLEGFLTNMFVHLKAGLGDYADAELDRITKQVDGIIKQLETQAKALLTEMIRKRDKLREMVADQRRKVLETVAKNAVKQARTSGLPVDAAEEIYKDIEKAVLDKFDKLADARNDVLDMTPKDVADLGQHALREGENLIRTAIGNALKVRQMILKTIASQRNSALAKLKKVAEDKAKKAGLPLQSVEMMYNKYEKIAKEQFDKFTENETELYGVSPKDVTDFASKVMGEVESGMQAIANEAAKKRDGVKKNLVKEITSKAKDLKLNTKQVADMVSEIGDYAEDQWDWLMGRSAGSGGQDIGKMASDVAKEAGSRISDMIKEAERRQREGESGEGDKVPLILRGAEEEKISSACFKFSVAGKSPDPKSKVLLCLNKKDNNIDITKGYGKAQLIDLFKLIDSKSLWGQKVNFFAMETTNGKPDDKTKSNVVTLRTPVTPFKGTISYTGIGADKTLKYTGNGKGRLLNYTKINGWNFFKYGGKYERDPAMRGFDCITFVGTAKKQSSGMDGRGDGLAAKLGAKKIDMEDVTHEKFVEFFKGDGKAGEYICWWSDHCFAVVNGTSYEFSSSKGGYFTGKATSYRFKGNKSVRKLG
ncbi:peptidoglycan-binding protein [Marimonas sp. MJW-29]|uniref:Peptidoglycan-binding protein n=1 Tax=Sulfitobacter sediminis TaxID=3234186 RepID=A0ABV3RH72_9RHOB